MQEETGDPFRKAGIRQGLREGSPMSTHSASRNTVEALAEVFLERRRRGEPATPEDNAHRHPELADEILALFPALLLMEDLGGEPASHTGSIIPGIDAVAGATA